MHVIALKGMSSWIVSTEEVAFGSVWHPEVNGFYYHKRLFFDSAQQSVLALFIKAVYKRCAKYLHCDRTLTSKALSCTIEQNGVDSLPHISPI